MLTLLKSLTVNQAIAPTKYCFDMIMHFEGLGPKATKTHCFPYICPAGKPTIGYGRVGGVKYA